MVVDQYKSDNGFKKIHKQLKLELRTLRSLQIKKGPRPAVNYSSE